tara:strand:- start:90 stop:458 length:369 start_codon:yes stop_codon:yes gene_type:complete
VADRLQHSCPECGPPKAFNDGSHKDLLRKVQNEDFYRCSRCKNEWFDCEIIKTPYKTIKFKDSMTGRTRYLPLTQAKLAEWKQREAGMYSKPFIDHQGNPKGRDNIGRFSSKDKNLLKRLRK